MKIKMKKVLALLLALSLVLVSFGDLAQVKAANYTDVTLTGTDGWSTSIDGTNQCLVLYLTTSGYESTNWAYKYEGFTYEYNGTFGTTTQVSSAENNRLYCTIPISQVPATEGTTFTIKSGTYDPDDLGTTVGLNIQNDIQIVVSEGRLVHTKKIEVANAEVDSENSNASSLYFTIKDANGNSIDTGYASDDYFLSPLWCDYTRVDPDVSGATIWSTISGGVFVDDSPINYWNAYFKQQTDGRYFVNLCDSNVATGTTVVIRGHFGASAISDWSMGGRHYYLQELSFTYDGSVWKYNGSDDEPTYTYEGTPTFSKDDGLAGGFYLTSDDSMTAPGWDNFFYALEGEENGIFVNGTKIDADDSHLQKTDESTWYVSIGADAAASLQVGDKVTVKGSFQLKDQPTTIVFKEELTVLWTGKHYNFNVINNLNDRTITELDYTRSMYDSSASVWSMYFKMNDTLPGDTSTYFPDVTYEVNGSSYTTNGFWTNEGQYLYIAIPNSQIPEKMEQEYTVTIKGGIYEGLVADANTSIGAGIWMKEDFSVILGTNYKSGSPTINYLEGTTSGGDADGIYLNATDSCPVTGWTTDLTAYDDNSGIYIYTGNAWEKTTVAIRKYEEGKYYVLLKDFGYSASSGTQVMIKGSFTLKGLYRVTFSTEKYVYSDGKWEIYSVTQEETSTGTGIYGNGNGDTELNSADLIRMKKYLAKDADEISFADADLNGTGNIDVNDIALERKLLIGLIEYEDGANITGVPTYDNVEDEMRLAAYVSPTTEGFADYKAAGFNTLISEHVAVYGTDGFNEYMKAAEDLELGVLVQSGYMQNMLTGSEAVSQTYLKDDLLANLSQYKSFRGLFMGDEPRIEYLDSYTEVTNILKQLNPEMELFTSCLQTYTNEEYLSTDTSLSLDEKYAKYAKAYGSLFNEFTYDFYPFRYKYSYKIFGSKIGEDRYMRSDWFKNLELAAKSAKGSYDTGITVQSYAENLVEKDHYRDVTKADISFQVYSALAYGMKSINYFTYGQHWDQAGVGTTNCMVLADGTKTEIYTAVDEVNDEIAALDHILLNYTWQGTIGISGDNDDYILDYVNSCESKRISAYSASNDAIIGCLKDVNGYDGFMLVNATDPYDNKTIDEISVTFKSANKAKVYINGEETIVPLTNGTYATSLAPGQGIFVIPYIAE